MYGAIENQYVPALNGVLNRRAAFLFAMVLLFGASVWASGFLGAELIPQFSQGEFSFNVHLPEGSPLEKTDAKLAEMEEIVGNTPGVESYFTSVGVASRLGTNAKSKDKNIGQLNIVLSEKGDPAIIYEQLKAKITERLDEPPSGEWSATDLEIYVWFH